MAAVVVVAATAESDRPEGNNQDGTGVDGRGEDGRGGQQSGRQRRRGVESQADGNDQREGGAGRGSGSGSGTRSRSSNPTHMVGWAAATTVINNLFVKHPEQLLLHSASKWSIERFTPLILNEQSAPLTHQKPLVVEFVRLSLCE